MPHVEVLNGNDGSAARRTGISETVLEETGHLSETAFNETVLVCTLKPFSRGGSKPFFDETTTSFTCSKCCLAKTFESLKLVHSLKCLGSYVLRV